MPTDQTFFQNYGLTTYQRGSNVLVNGLSEGVSQLFLAGRGDRSYFDLRPIATRFRETETIIRRISSKNSYLSENLDLGICFWRGRRDQRVCKIAPPSCSESYRDSATQRPTIGSKFEQSLAVRRSRLKIKEITGIDDCLGAHGQTETR